MPAKIALLLYLLCPVAAFAQGWIQIGGDIDGAAIADLSGQAVSMPDAFTVAVGAPHNDENGLLSGQVRVYAWNGSAWVQKGANLNGEADSDRFGYSVSMPDSNTLAIGARFNDGGGLQSGHVRVYTWNGAAWVQKGSDVDGEAEDNWSGHAVSMPDANTLAIGALSNDDNGPGCGHVRVFAWNGSAWAQKGGDMDGESSADSQGYSVSMPDPNTVAMGATGNDGGGIGAGHVRVYVWDGATWVQKGADIDGEPDDRSGAAVSMPDANTVAIGSTDNSHNGNESGHVRVYNWTGSAWTQKGSDLDGEAIGDRSGFSVSMPDANTVAIGAEQNNGGGTLAGHVRVYAWTGTIWVQQGADIDGEAAGDLSGHSVSMPDANTLAIGAVANAAGGIDAGHVRIHTYTLSTALAPSELPTISFHPNPTKGELNIDLGKAHHGVVVSITNVLGVEVERFVSEPGLRHLAVWLDGPNGAYTVTVFSGAIVQARKTVLKL